VKTIKKRGLKQEKKKGCFTESLRKLFRLRQEGPVAKAQGGRITFLLGQYEKEIESGESTQLKRGTRVWQKVKARRKERKFL